MRAQPLQGDYNIDSFYWSEEVHSTAAKLRAMDPGVAVYLLHMEAVRLGGETPRLRAIRRLVIDPLTWSRVRRSP